MLDERVAKLLGVGLDVTIFIPTRRSASLILDNRVFFTLRCSDRL
jgi:hypothetical protein